VFKIFSFGIFSGAAIAACLLYFVPAVDQHREASLISVQANGGNTEAFHVNLPGDRILAATGSEQPIPASLEWPDEKSFQNAQTELFKLRNRNGAVVGVASRISGPVGGSGSIVEWTLHLPARGTLYASLESPAGTAGTRTGSLRAGTREFAEFHGSISERFSSPDGNDDAEADVEGRIELVTSLVGSPIDTEEDAE